MPEVRDQIKTQTAPVTNKKKAQGLTFRRFFTKPGVSPYNEVEWELRDALISDSQGSMIFEQKNVEVPKDWSMTATNIVASTGRSAPRSARPECVNW
jgi:ribonucleoside-diphosphate reductase alpha chain